MPPTTPSLCARKAFRLIFAPSVPSTPNVASLRVSAIRRAEATNDLVGMHATLMHVPPTYWRSTMATSQPFLACAMAKDFPALPPPTTSKSTCSMPVLSLSTMTMPRRRQPISSVWFFDAFDIVRQMRNTALHSLHGLCLDLRRRRRVSAVVSTLIQTFSCRHVL